MTANIEAQYKQGLIYTIRLLTLAKRSERDIHDRLVRKGYHEQAIAKIIDQLKKQHLINDLEYSKQKIFWAAHGNPIGRRKIWGDLKKKGISRELIDQVLETYDVTEEKTRAHEAAAARLAKLQKLEPLKQKKRLYDYLTRRGFPYEICRDVVTEVMQGDRNLTIDENESN
ncbi:MAG: hypothetical protein COV74_01795 [Candidatus Omnitrophica bacterium CG11_big_fil_rev_8_21_14_0_20_45_26]|uniref:Regulatory protein RecX n=1 Tax=Candidatus Abzuiibacterium crystallinum TaxID=1974748 RepID=A0A2H0LS72_9BACT|nr:MAG: hypothetical protein COV74_01795 [Candidatus Omnitrophica bacterium CG11_big_fil_rev_8_21_14_0_20_45_26]PIW65029.1 MAG: hypothetical protein COW12_04075 [Candidatus Omnitrophica bacterium CG12_big_fil_rev_8_21_14_0_65_45_16]